MKEIFCALRDKVAKQVNMSKQLNKTKLLRTAAYVGVASMAIYALCFICPPVQDNDSHAITGTSVASDTTLSISLSGSELPLDITPTSASGTFASTADDDTGASTAVIRVATNNITGYTLGIKASNPVSSSADKLISNNEKCENTPTSNKCAISSLSQPVSSEDYIDNTVEGIDLNNTWGYAPSHYNSSSNIDSTTGDIVSYYPAPVTGDTIATTDAPNQENTTTNDGTLLEDEYTIDYGMRIDYTPYTGTYSTNYNNQSYIITAVGNPVPYSVSYNANIPTGLIDDVSVTNMPTAQTGNVQGGDTVAVILSPKVPTLGSINPSTGEYEYAGYVFNGWCTVRPTKDQTTGYQTCPVDQQQPDQARLFQPGDNFGIDQTSENTQILYAVWGAPAKVTFDSNGLAFNDTAADTTNIMQYIPTYTDGKITGDKANTAYSGTYKTPTLLTTENYIFKGWSADQNATEATYQNKQDITNDLNLNADDNITLYAIWTYTTVITFDGNGADSGTMEPFVIEAGQTEALPQNTFAKEGYGFIGWNTVANPTEQNPGTSYTNHGDYTAEADSHDVTLYAQWATTVITFNGNGSDGGEDMNSINIPAGGTVNLPANTYTKDGYAFTGWNTAEDGTGTSYQDKASYSAATANASITLYAQWKQVFYMQDVATWGSTLSQGDTMEAVDSRDGKSYWVAKLADGNIWMTQNLDLDLNSQTALTPENTNISANWTPTNSTIAFTGTSVSGWTDSHTVPYSADPGDVYYYSSGDTSNDTQYTSLEACQEAHPDCSAHNHAGNYYNWSAAVASNNTNTTELKTQFNNAPDSICPAGWRLPIARDSDNTAASREWNALLVAEGIMTNPVGSGYATDGFNNIRISPLWLARSGSVVYTGSLGSTGSSGNYWSSTVGDSNYAHRLNINSGRVYPTDYTVRGNGYSIRCVAE